MGGQVSEIGEKWKKWVAKAKLESLGGGGVDRASQINRK